MAKSLITRHEIESLVNMKLSAESEKEMKSKLAKIFDGADIDFNSKDFERSFKNIVTAFNAVFKEAGVDAVDLMPGKDEFKKLGEIAYNEFMSAWKTVGEKGGMKFNFNTDQLDEVIEKLDIIAKNTAKTTQKSLKKSADEINAAIYRLGEAKEKYEAIKEAIEYDGKGQKPKRSELEDYRKKHDEAKNWEEQYQYLIKYVKTYERLSKSKSTTFTTEQTDAYKTLSKQVDQAKTALSNLLITKEQIGAGMTIGGGSSTVSINSESLAQEETLGAIKDILEKRLPAKNNSQNTEKSSSNNVSDTHNNNDTLGKDKPVTKSDLEEYVVYRAVDDYEDKRTTREEGFKNYNAEYWADSKKTAESYTDAHYGTSYILKGKITPRNPLIIDAEEAQWDDFKHMPKLMELFPDLADFMDKKKNPRYDSDSGQAYINEQAKKAGYDVVIMKNVQDGYMADQDGDAPLTTTFAVLEDSVLSITSAFKEIAEEDGNKKFSKTEESIPSFYDVPEHQKNELMRTTTVKAIEDETAALTQQNEELKENNTLKREVNDIPDEDGRNRNIDDKNNIQKLDTTAEIESLENVRAKVEAIKTEIGNKTQAFTEEETEVKRVVNEEIKALEPLEAKVKSIKDAIKGLNEQTPAENSSTNAQPNESIKPEDSNLINNEDLAEITQLRNDIKIVAENIKSIIDNVATDETSLQQSIRNITAQVHSVITADRAQLGKLNSDIEKLQTNLTELFKNITSSETNIAAGLSNINVTVNHPETQQNDLEPTVNAINDLIAKLDSNTVEHKDGENDDNKTDATETTAKKTARDTNRINRSAAKIYSTLKNIRSQKDELTNLSNTVAKENTLSKILQSVENIDHKTIKGSGVGNKQAPVNDLEKQAQKLGQMQAKYKVSGNLKLKQEIDRLVHYIKAKEISLEMSQQEIDNLEKRRVEAYDDEIMLSKADEKEKDRVHTIRDLERLHRQLGAAEGRLAVGGYDNEALEQEIEIVKEDIAEKKKLITVNESLLAQFDKMYNNSKTQTIADETLREKRQWQTDFELLNNKNQQLAKLDAQAETTDDPVIQERARYLREIVDAEFERLKLNEQQHAQDKDALQTLYEKVRAEETRLQLAKQDKKNIADNIKKARQEARDSKMSSTRRAGDDAIRSLWKMEGFAIDDLKDLPDVKALQEAITTLKTTQSDVNTKIRNKQELTTEDDDKIKESIANVEKYTLAVKDLVKNYEFFSSENSVDLKTKLDPGQDVKTQLIEAANALHDGKIKIQQYDAATQQLTYEVKEGAYEFTTYTAGVRDVDGALRTVQGTTKKTETLFESIARKTKDVFTYFSGSSVIYKGIEELRRGIQYVREIDAAMTELKKVTDETEESYERFLDTASKTADKVGSTVAEIVNSTADWSRLGYSLEDAASLAETTSVLLNVSEFGSIDEATSALTSTLQAFGYTADNGMRVVDVMNEVGNNFAVSSNGIATALQDSASALMSANNSYEEAVALVAAANRVVQDPNSVGSALRTISLRLRGTSVKELEEAGEDTTGAIESSSKLRSKVKSLSGVDILTDSGAYKSTYEILLEISKVWKNISDIDQAALLEILAGKNRANTAAAILSNTKDLEKAYESAMGADGSALRENEKYLDSIQGKIDQFTNAYQTMWNNTLDDEWVKGIVDAGTEIVKLIDKIGGLRSAFIAIASIAMIKTKTGPIEFLTQIVDATTKAINKAKQMPQNIMSAVAGTKQLTTATLEQSVANGTLTTTEAIRQASTHQLTLSQAALTDAELGSLLTTQGLSEAEQKNIIGKLGLQSTTNTLTLATLQQAIADGKLTTSEALHVATATRLIGAETSLTAARGVEILTTNNVDVAEAKNIVTKLGLDTSTKKLTADTILQAVANGTLTTSEGALAMSMLTASGATNGLAASFKALWTALGPIGWAILGVTAALTIGISIFNAVYKTTEELAEELSDLSAEVSDIESEIDSLNSELETTQDRMAELLALPSLSFTEQEELENLKLQNAELERKIALQETLKKSKEEEKASTSKEYIDKVWNTPGADKAYYLDENDVIHKDEGWNGFRNAGMDTKAALNSSMQKYSSKKDQIDTAENLLAHWDSYSDYQKYKMSGKINLGSFFKGVSEEEFNKRPNDFATLSKDDLQDKIDSYRDDLSDISDGINMVLGDENFDNLEYGKSKDVDAFLDELYAYGYKWQEIQGNSNKSGAIASIFDDTASDEIQALETALQNISNDESLNIEDKNAKISQAIDEAYTSTSAGYDRLRTMMDTVGIKSDEIANYFTLEGGVSDFRAVNVKIEELGRASKTFEQLLSGDTFKVDGIDTGLADLFDEEGKIIQTKLSQVFNNTSKQTRDEITSVLESSYDAIKDGLDNGEIDGLINSVGLKFARQIMELEKIELSNLNLDLFPGLEDEISGIIDTFDELTSAVGNVVDAMDALDQARAEEAYSGSVSLETLELLMQSTDNYADLIEVDETGAIRLATNAQEILVQQKINAIKKNAELALSDAQLAYEEALHADQTLNGTSPAQEVLRGVLNEVGGALTFVTSLWSDLSSGNWAGAWERASAARESAISKNEAAYKTQQEAASASVEEAAKRLEEAEKMNRIAQNLTPENIKTRYDSETASGGTSNKDDAEKKKAEDATNDAADKFKEAMEYWENRIGAQQDKYEQVQNEIDLLEKQGKRAGANYYRTQGLIEEGRLELLEQQKEEAKEMLKTFDEGSDEWWEVADTLNSIEGEIDDVTASIQDLKDAMHNIKWDSLEELHNRFSDIFDDISDIRDILSSEDMFDDEGQWTEAGVATLGTHVDDYRWNQGAANEILNGRGKFGDDDYIPALQEFLDKAYAGNEAHWANIGIDSEQEYNDKKKELTDYYNTYIKATKEAEKSVVEMYENQIDAVEEYTSTLIEGYNDYIEVAKEALDAERDLYEFKKNTSEKTKNIAQLERRIASLSGSDNAADIAERRRLQAELTDAKSDLDDHYYSHAKDQQQQALDEEALAYEESMNNYIEGLRTTLDTATLDMTMFMEQVIVAVSTNAETVEQKYHDTGLAISEDLKAPWTAAKNAMKDYEGEQGLGLMNKWLADGQFFDKFKTDATSDLKAPWNAGVAAADAFDNKVGAVMGSMLGKIQSNVVTAKDELQKVFNEINKINTTTVRPKVENSSSGGGNNDNGGNPSNPGTPDKKLRYYYVSAMVNVGGRKLEGTGKNINKEQAKKIALTSLMNNVYKHYTDRNKDTAFIEKIWDKRLSKNVQYSDPKPVYYAKGTTGTTKDHWAVTDEPWLGDELVLVPGKNGNLQYMRKGTAVMPADISENLMEWGKLNPNMANMSIAGMGMNVISNAINKPEINLSFEALVKAERIDKDTLPEVKKFVQQEVNSLVKQMNYALKGVGSR